MLLANWVIQLHITPESSHAENNPNLEMAFGESYANGLKRKKRKKKKYFNFPLWQNSKKLIADAAVRAFQMFSQIRHF
jgi:hypothetical protein